MREFNVQLTKKPSNQERGLLLMVTKNMSDYERRMIQEIEHYEKVFKGRLNQDVPPIWYRVEEHFSKCMEKITGVRNLYQYVGNHTLNKKKVKILGLGSGACGNELDGIAPVLRQNGCEMELICVDINDAALNQAKVEADKRFIKFTAIKQDINTIVIDNNEYDVIVAYASLHHFVELDYITRQINKGLKKDGIFVTVDIPTRNGFKMWDETYDIVKNIWNILPPKFKIDHTGFSEPRYLETYENLDYSTNSFECINSEAIIPALRKNLCEEDFVPCFSLARRFFDTKFGPNYDLHQSLDRSIFEFIMQLDEYYINSKILQPETFFGSYSKKS